MNNSGSLLLILTDTITTRLYFEAGIMERLAERTPLKLVVMTYGAAFNIEDLSKRFRGIKFVNYFDVLEQKKLSFPKKALILIDQWLDKHFGHIPMAIRFSLINKFNSERFRRGHKNSYYNLDLVGPLPKWKLCYWLMRRWYFSFARYIHPAAPEFLKTNNVRAIISSNCQSGYTHNFVFAGRKMGIPMVGSVASWDHPVGKGIIPKYFSSYLVQNRLMKDQLVEYHKIPSDRILITGWPQMDKYVKDNERPKYENLMKKWGLNPDKKCVLMAGNSAINSPYEPLAFRRLIEWRDNTQGADAFSIVVRPHPKDFIWKERYENIFDFENVHIQAETISDMDELAIMLRHVSCVVCTAGTILLDGIANDRPVVGLMYDEQNPTGTEYAIKNYFLFNYRPIMDSNSFYRAADFNEATAGIERALSNPDELGEERARLRALLIGEMDGNRTSAVVNVLLESVQGITNPGSSLSGENAHESH